MPDGRKEMKASYPARCNGCGTTSEPRPLGQTPLGWKRGESLHTATFTGQGCYFCEPCWSAVKQRV